ncbi:MAG: hypothetical protein ACRC02_03925 [Vogesella sp.]|uniref:hypothetical protein n=1 Tax=Vogesella sp. TaxID=1904252 RepID=UPI003F2C8113
MLSELKRKLLCHSFRKTDGDNDSANGRGGDTSGRSGGESSDGGGGDGGDDDGGHQDWGGGGRDRGNTSDNEGDGSAGGNALERAARESSAGWGQAEYGDVGPEIGLHDLLGTDGTASGLANKLKETPVGFNPDGSTIARTDRDVSEGMAAAGIGYMDRARQVGAIDAITQGDATRALSRAVEMGLVLSNPIAGPALAVGDAVVDGASTGKWGRLGGLAGGAIGARAGLDIASGFANSANGAIAAAIGGTTLGGAAGSSIGRAIGNGQGSVAQNDNPTQERNGDSGAPAQAQETQRPATVAATSTGADGMGSSFYDFLATYGAGASKTKG